MLSVLSIGTVFFELLLDSRTASKGEVLLFLTWLIEKLLRTDVPDLRQKGGVCLGIMECHCVYPRWCWLMCRTFRWDGWVVKCDLREKTCFELKVRHFCYSYWGLEPRGIPRNKTCFHVSETCWELRWRYRHTISLGTREWLAGSCSLNFLPGARKNVVEHGG